MNFIMVGLKLYLGCLIGSILAVVGITVLFGLGLIGYAIYTVAAIKRKKKNG